MASLPNMRIPPSSNTVSIRIIDSTTRFNALPLAPFVSPVLPGMENMAHIPSFSFLIEHPNKKPHLFDLGVRKHLDRFPPRVQESCKKWDVVIEKDVSEVLSDHGIQPSEIGAVFWSHFHFDHTGDMTTFPKSVDLVVGPGFKNKQTPGYPENQDSSLTTVDWAGRNLVEIDFDSGLKIGRFDACDYFGDGSFFLLGTPGHSADHMCGLARVNSNSNGDHFILMGGDVCHHAGEIRPSEYLPLPTQISPNPLDSRSQNPCPGSLFEPVLRDGDRSKSIYLIKKTEGGKGQIADDADEAQRSIEKVQEADAHDTIFVAFAHDDALLEQVDLFPEYANDFVEKGWVNKTRWTFLRDFKELVHQH